MLHCRSALVRARRLLCVALALAWVSATRAPAAAPSVIDASSETALVDFTRGLIVATGEAAADMRAPSPEVARVKAERQARELAERRLMERARLLLAADGSSSADLAPARERALAQAVAHVIDLELSYASDGSVVLQAGLPLEALRLGLQGVPAYVPIEPGSVPYQSVVIDAHGQLARPVFGVRVLSPDGPLAGPTVFHQSLKQALADPRIGDRILVVRGDKAASGGAANSQEKPALGGVDLQLDPADGATSSYLRQRGAPARSKSASASASIRDVAPALASGALLIIVIGKGP
jgi:hypothetical protein